MSFWYCFDADGTPRAVLAEVHNTYRDHHNYLLHNDGAPYRLDARPEHTKAFYVSPFIQRENVRYQFAFSEPGATLSVGMQNYVDGSLMLTTDLALEAQPITDRAALAHRAGVWDRSRARALVLIHWQALKLLLKRVGLYRTHGTTQRGDVALR